VVAISCDSRGILEHFANRMKITYPLLSDVDSKIIKSFGILNTNIPEGQIFYGIPFPGTYIVDSHGKVLSKYFEESHRQRFTADTILVKEFGLGGSRKTEVRTDHLKIDAFASQYAARPGNRISIVLDIELPDRMHLYAPGAEGYKTVSLNIQEDPALKIHDPQYPAAKIMYLRVIKERVPTYEKKVRITRDVTISPGYRPNNLVISGTFDYQACDEKICYLPVKVPLRFELEIQEHDNKRVPDSVRNKPAAPGIGQKSP
jgi:hypothetical protein